MPSDNGDAPTSPVECDESEWPLVVVRWPARALDDEEWRAAIEKIASYAHRERPYAVVQDATVSRPPSAHQRRVAAEIGDRDRVRSSRWMRATAVVVPNKAIAGVLTALNWMFPPPYPQKNFADLEDARRWALEMLEKD
jgi:hypothetical protein